ncbi:MAG TPA: TylF/MycF/NovP-related O-methyltransferase [Thermoanaerobaculia bacterium]
MSFLFDLEPEFLGLYELCREQTMTSIERMYALYTATRYVIGNQIPGDFAECGVWRGGSVTLIAHTLLRLGKTDRTLWLYDTFDGMPPPSVEDVQEMSGRSASEILAEHDKSADDPFWGVAPRAVVEANLRRTGYPIDRTRFIEGDVMTTIPTHAPEQIALLRLDTDWYTSTSHELQHLYPRVAPGGIVIIDDYGYWRGARKATDEYLASLPASPLLHRIDYTGRMWVK